MRFRRLVAPVLLTAVVGLVSAPGAQATSSTVRVGIADQSTGMFSSASYKALGLKRTRYVIRWNAADDPAELQRADAFIAAAKADKVSVLLHISTDNYTPREAKLPSVAQYRSKVGALIARYYPMGVREWGVWNEANDRTQPTYRSPARAAQFFKAMWSMLARSSRCATTVTGRCTIVGLDILDGRTKGDQGNARSYIRRFYKELSPTYDRRARIVGIHNYTDTNRHGTSGTKNVITETRKAVKSARFWLTETGGVVKLGNTGSFTCRATSPSSVARAEERAKSAVSWMFSLAKRYRSSIDRLYVYQWSGTSCTTRFDAGLTRLDGTPRPALAVVRSQLRASSILKP
jgi:hypothetical protein